jgi:hypothetical protein
VVPSQGRLSRLATHTPLWIGLPETDDGHVIPMRR